MYYVRMSLAAIGIACCLWWMLLLKLGELNEREQRRADWLFQLRRIRERERKRARRAIAASRFKKL